MKSQNEIIEAMESWCEAETEVIIKGHVTSYKKKAFRPAHELLDFVKRLSQPLELVSGEDLLLEAKVWEQVKAQNNSYHSPPAIDLINHLKQFIEEKKKEIK